MSVVLNAAIESYWSPVGLDYIKHEAWKSATVAMRVRRVLGGYGQ